MRRALGVGVASGDRAAVVAGGGPLVVLHRTCAARFCGCLILVLFLGMHIPTTHHTHAGVFTGATAS